MISSFLLSLSVTLVFSDGSHDVISSDNQPEMFSNRPPPCKGTANPHALNAFINNHILQHHFDTSKPSAWASYLTAARICGVQPHLSFLHKNDFKNIVHICKGQGVRDTDNMCISVSKFRVFIVQSVMRNGHCQVQLQIEHAHLIVACEAYHNFCFPVHFGGFTYRLPPGHSHYCTA
ncbi:hypothetical protein QQF64_031064 [Cirrhinus molitorella]|uniref:Uncharacterized protein n=1 Tax=Cirrhinus molitorella TaxID=172907 RepID=A0ABR3N5E4_9TELE